MKKQGSLTGKAPVARSPPAARCALKDISYGVVLLVHARVMLATTKFTPGI